MRSDDGHYTRLNAPDATKRVFGAMFSPVIMLLLGGFAIAGALSKFGIAKSMATYVLSKAGTRPSRVLIVNMMVATVASMWISNVAAPVLCFSLIQVTKWLIFKGGRGSLGERVHIYIYMHLKEPGSNTY